jgi:HK97 family phage prohead protease
MLWGGIEASGLEVRAKGGSRIVSGSFPYNSRAVLSDGGRRGRPRKEQFAPHAFKFSVDENIEVHVLVGHSFDKPLASRGAGTLILEDTAKALNFEATITPEIAGTSHGQDALAMLSAGLIAGISPGFRIPPERTVPNAESIEEEDPAEGTAIIRTINDAILYELSLVTRPAYPETQVEARCWQPTAKIQTNRASPRFRWR